MLSFASLHLLPGMEYSYFWQKIFSLLEKRNFVGNYTFRWWWWLYSRVECGSFFWSDRTGQLTKGQAWFYKSKSKILAPVRVARTGANALKFSFLKNSWGLKYQYFFVKIYTKLPLTIKNNRRNMNLKFEFQNYFIFTPEKAHFWFLKKNTQKKFLTVLALIQL